MAREKAMTTAKADPCGMATKGQATATANTTTTAKYGGLSTAPLTMKL
jgi:hypothetical protein